MNFHKDLYQKSVRSWVKVLELYLIPVNEKVIPILTLKSYAEAQRRIPVCDWQTYS